MKKAIIFISAVVMILSFAACSSQATQEIPTQQTETASPTLAPTVQPTAAPSPTPEPGGSTGANNQGEIVTPESNISATCFSSAGGFTLAQKDKGWVYYCISDRTAEGIYRTNDDFITQQMLVEGTRLRLVTIEDDWVYYIALNEGLKDSLFRVKTDGSTRECVKDTIKPEGIGVYRYMDGVVYYVPSERVMGNIAEANGEITETTITRQSTGIYRLGLDGVEMEELSDTIQWDIVIASNHIFYSNPADNGYLYKMELDGTDIEKVAEIDVSFSTHDGYTDLVFAESTLIMEDGDWIYYRDIASDTVKRISKAKGVPDSRVFPNATLFAEGWIFYVAVIEQKSDVGVLQSFEIRCVNIEGEYDQKLLEVDGLGNFTLIDGKIIYEYIVKYQDEDGFWKSSFNLGAITIDGEQTSIYEGQLY